MYWRLLPTATAAIVSSRIVLLDIRQDRYFMVPEIQCPAFQAWLEARDGSAPPGSVTRLFERGGIARSGDPDPSNTAAQTVQVPTMLAVPPQSDRPTIGEKLHIASLVAATRLALRVRPLRKILGRRDRRLIYRAAGATQRVRERCSLYDSARPLIPIARNCLVDSLALDGWLAGEDLACRLVFGVTVQPFAAHCWLQTVDAVLNDGLDRVSRFTPILAQ